MRATREYPLKNEKKPPHKEKNELETGTCRVQEKKIALPSSNHKIEKDNQKTPKHFQRKQSPYLASRQIRSNQKKCEDGNSNPPPKNVQSHDQISSVKSLHYIRQAVSPSPNKISEIKVNQDKKMNQKQSMHSLHKIEKQLRIQLNNIRKLNEILENQNQAIKQKNDYLTKENKNYKAIFSSRTEEMQKNIQKPRQPHQENRKLTRNIKSSQKYADQKIRHSHQNEHLHQENEQLKVENHRLKEKVKCYEIERDSMKKKLYQFQKDHTNLKSKNKKLMERISSINEEKKPQIPIKKKFLKKQEENSLEFSLQN